MNKKTFINKLYRTISISLLVLVVYTSLPTINLSDYDDSSLNNLISICSDNEKDKNKFNQYVPVQSVVAVSFCNFLP